MRSLKLLGLLVAAVVVHSLHVQQPLNQLVGYDMRAELQKLEAQHAALEAAIDKISANLDVVNNRVTQTNDTEKVLLLENAIQRERQEIYNVSTMILPPFNLSKCSCENLTDKEKVLMLSDLDNFKKNVQTVRQTLRNVPRCEKIDALNRDIQKQLFFVKSMQAILYAKCLKVLILSPTIYQTNLYVDNWISGDQTADEIVDEYYQRAQRYRNVTNCPLSKPFFVGTECIACHEPTPVFNLLQRRCVSCGPGGSVDATARKCVNRAATFKTNYDAPNYSLEGLQGIPPPPPNAVQTCPLSTPFFNGVKCISCPPPTYYSVLNGFCKSCPEGRVFSSTSKTCVDRSSEVPGKFSTNFEAANFIVPSDKTLEQFKSQQSQRRRNDAQVRVCPLETPYSDGQKCFNCERTPYTYFNLQTKKCTTCPGVSKYDPQQHRCFATQNVTTVQRVSASTVGSSPFQTNPSITPNLIFDGISMQQYKYTYEANIASNPGIKDCDPATPYWNGKQCITCSREAPYFNLDAKVCQSCSPGSQYNSKTRQCEDRQGKYINQGPTIEKIIAGII